MTLEGVYNNSKKADEDRKLEEEVAHRAMVRQQLQKLEESDHKLTDVVELTRTRAISICTAR